eukprot:scaffold32021_cov75-Attheya_sp.AAC.1
MPKQVKVVAADHRRDEEAYPTDSVSKKSARLADRQAKNAAQKAAKLVKTLADARALVAAQDTNMEPAPAASPSKHADKRSRSEKGYAHLTANTTAGSPGDKRKGKAKGKDKGAPEAAKTTKAQITPEKDPVPVPKPKSVTQAEMSDPVSTPLPVTPTKTTKETPISLMTPGKQANEDRLMTPRKQDDVEMTDTNPQQVLDAPPTPKRRNWTPDNSNERDASVYFDLQMEVEESNKKEAVGKLKDIAAKFFSVIQDADPTAILGNFTSSDNQRALLVPANTPTTITKLGQFFMRARPNPAGGVIYTAVRIAFNGDESNLMRNTEFELSDLNIRLFRRPLQVQETVRKGWFCGVPSGVCTVALQGVLIAIMRENQIKGLSEREIRNTEPIVMSL